MTSITTNAIAVRHNGVLGMDRQYALAKADVLKTVPISHNRILIRETEALYRKAVEDCSYGEAEVTVGSWVYYVHRVNLGTTKYPDFIERIEYSQVESVGPQTVIMANGHRPFHQNLLAVYTGVQ